jgi:diadenosine tetraphosphate (Ap4A) HIT family hydrolase
MNMTGFKWNAFIGKEEKSVTFVSKNDRHFGYLLYIQKQQYNQFFRSMKPLSKRLFHQRANSQFTDAL